MKNLKIFNYSNINFSSGKSERYYILLQYDKIFATFVILKPEVLKKLMDSHSEIG